MKVYIASSFDLKDKVINIYHALKIQGIETIVKWWEKDYKEIVISDDEWYQLSEVRQVKERNYKGVDDADAVILVCPDIESKAFNGANLEVGYAVAKGKPVYSVGKLDRSAMYCDVHRCKFIGELISKLTGII